VNKDLQIQIDAIRSVDEDSEKVKSLILLKKTLWKDSKDVHESGRFLRSLTAWNGYSGK
jgi:hypothetical protein